MLALSSALLLSAPVRAAAQFQLADLGPKLTNATSIGAHAAPLLRDLDGDGRAELVLAFDASVRVYRGLPGGQFADVNSAAAAIPFAWAVHSTAAGDMDGDGDIDLYLADTDRIRLLRNDGNLTFSDVTAANLQIALTWPNQLLPRDVDGDGDVDLLAPTNRLNIPNVLWLNDGTGRLTDVVATNMPPAIVPTFAAEFADVDRDGDPDIVLASLPGPRLLTNDGTGRFADVTATTLPPQTAPQRDVATGDVDRDGDIDLVFLNSQGVFLLYANDGTGRFTDVSSGRIPPVLNALRIDLVDLDMDGALDLIVERTRDGGFERYVEVMRNDGAGLFQQATQSMLQPSESPPSNGVAYADVDGDGRTDMFVARDYARNALFLGQGPTLADFWAPKVPVGGENLIFGTPAVMFDMDRDGDLDLVGGPRPDLLRNDGLGRFLDVTTSKAPGFAAVAATDVAQGDVDGDGDVDLVFAPSRLFLNDGTGGFTDASNRLLRTGFGGRCALGDVNGDGRPDLVFTTTVAGQRPGLWLNDGTGNFPTETVLSSVTQSSRDARFADIDGDGDLDLVVACSGQSRVFVNDGQGQLTDETTTRLGTFSLTANSLDIGDLDGDGDVDVVFGTRIGTPRAYMNDGSGIFSLATAAYLPFITTAHEELHLFDADVDGDLDLVAGSTAFGSSRRLYVYRNLGSNFAVDATLVDGATTAHRFASGDVDGDGDVDLYIRGGLVTSLDMYSRNRLLTNVRSQIEVVRVPYVGGTLELNHYGRTDTSFGSHTSTAFLAAALLPTPLSLPQGRLFIDPTVMVQLPSVSLPAGGAVVSQPLPIPGNPGLSGAVLYLQHLVLRDADPFGSLRLGNALSEVIR